MRLSIERFIVILSLFCLIAGAVYAQSTAIGLDNLVAGTCSVNDWSGKRIEISRKLLSYLGSFPEKKVPLSGKVLSEKKIGDITVKKVTFMSETDDLIYAYLLVPPLKAFKQPAILALHQTMPFGKEEVVGFLGSPDLAYGIELAKRGYVVLAPDSLAVGERLSASEQAWSTDRFYKRHPEWSAVGKAIWDNMIAIDYIQSLTYVDKERIGVIGHSQGGIYAYFLAAFDERVKATVANCSLMTITGDPDPYRWSRESWWVGIPKLRKSLKEGSVPFDTHEIIALIAPRAFLSINATHDDIIPHYQGVLSIEEKVAQVYKLLGRSGNLEVVTFSGKHSFPVELRAMAYKWLDVHLGTK